MSRAESVEDVVNRGDELTVRVVEVNKERGRIGLRLADDPEVEGKSVEELAKMGTGSERKAVRRRTGTEPWPRWPRWPRPAPATAARERESIT